MYKETNINNQDKETKSFSVPEKKDIITSVHVDGNWGDIVTKYKNGKTVNYTEEIDFSEFEQSDHPREKKEAA